MLSGIQTHAADVPNPTKLSRKARRALLHSSPSSESILTQSRNSESGQPDSVTGGEEGFAVSKNPYVEVINKKLRALKKKLNKVEKYETQKGTLNADQLQALERKPEVVSAYRELEEVLRQFQVTEAEEAQAAARRHQVSQHETQEQINLAVHKVEDESAHKSRSFLQLLYALNVSLPNAISSSLSITEEEFNALSYFRTLLTGAGLDENESIDSFLDVASSNLDKYLANRDEEFVQDITYAQLASTVETVLHPPPPPKFEADATEETQEAPHEEAESTNVDEEAEESSGPAVNGISFFNPSELLDITTEVTEIHTEQDGVTTDLIVEHVVIEHPTQSPEPVTADVESTPVASEVADAAAGDSASADNKATNESQNGRRGRGRGGYRGRGGRGGQGNQSRGGAGLQGNRGGFRGRSRGGAAGGAPGGAPRPQ